MRKTPISMWWEEWFCGDTSAFSLFIFLVATASTTERKVYTNRGLIKLWVWQLVFDRVRFSKFIWLSPSGTLATCMRIADKFDKISIKSDSKKTIVTIVDYLSVVWFENTKWQSNDNQTTVEWQSKNTKKTVKNDKTEEIIIDAKASIGVALDSSEDSFAPPSDLLSPPPTPSPPKLSKSPKPRSEISLEIDQCLEIIKSFNEWTINGAKGKQRMFAKHLISKIKEMPKVQSWQFTRDQTLRLVISLTHQSEHYSQWTGWPQEIHSKRASLLSIAKKNHWLWSGDLSQYDIN